LKRTLDTLACILAFVALVVILLSGYLPPAPVESAAEPGLTQIETHELTGGALQVFKNSETREYVYVYEGRQPVIAVMGGKKAR
jgi:hypothetical protein